MTYNFTKNPKAVFDGGFTLSFWMKIDTSKTTVTGNRDEFRIVFYRGSGSYKTLDTVVARADFTSGDWVHISKTINWNGSFNNGSSMHTDSATETYTMEIRAFEGNGKVADATSSDSFAYWIDDFSIVPINYVKTKSGFSSLSITGDAVVSDNIGVTAVWDGGAGDKTEGNSIVRILKETAAGSDKFVVVKEFFGSDKSQMVFTIPEGYEGLKIKIEALPVATDGTKGAYTYSEATLVVGWKEVSMELSSFNQGEVRADIEMINRNKNGKNINAVLAIVMYDDKNEIIRYAEKNVSCVNTYSDVPNTDYLEMTATEQELPKVSYVCAYLWDSGENSSADFLNTLMYELAPMEMVQNN